MSDTTNFYTTSTNNIEPIRTENSHASAYRLAQRKDGSIVLQGAFFWIQGFKSGGHTWKDIPMHIMGDGET